MPEELISGDDDKCRRKMRDVSGGSIALETLLPNKDKHNNNCCIIIGAEGIEGAETIGGMMFLYHSSRLCPSQVHLIYARYL
jgi:hypothetical protein